MPRLITVRANRAVVGDRVALWERHPDHPGGEVLIAAPVERPAEPVTVAETPAVLAALRDEKLLRAEEEAPPPLPPAVPTDPPATEPPATEPAADATTATKKR